MFTTFIKPLTTVVRRTATAVSSAARAVPGLLRRGWTRHCHLMDNSPAYRMALVSGITTVISQLRLARWAVSVVVSCLGLYAAAHQSFDIWRAEPPGYEQGYYGWGQE